MATRPKALRSKHAGAHPDPASPPRPPPSCPQGSSNSRCHLAPSSTMASGRTKDITIEKKNGVLKSCKNHSSSSDLLEGRDGGETELKASNLPDRDPPVTAACQRMPELPKHVQQLSARRQPRPRSHTPGNHAGTARAAMATSHSVAIMEPQLPSEGSALLSITGLVLTLTPLPKPSPSALPAAAWPLRFVTGEFCSLAPGLEIMQIHFSPRCKEVTPGLCNALVPRPNKHRFVQCTSSAKPGHENTCDLRCTQQESDPFTN